MDKNNCTRYLSDSGYIIRKKNLSPQQENRIRKELTVCPFEHLKYMKQKYGPPPIPFKVFYENQNKLYVPRFWAIKEFGEPELNLLINRGEDINIQFDGSLNNTQETITENFIPHLKKTGGGILNLRCGMGKCLAKSTPIIMYDGSIKKVENIQVGDVLMGDDCKERIVKSLARGREEMARIEHFDGDYTVNMSHILSLKTVNGQCKDMSVREYLSYKGEPLYGYRIPISFKRKATPQDPYLFGLKMHELSNMTVIPNTYIINDFSIRAKFLTGFIDGGQFFNGYMIIQNNIIRNQLKFIIQSLGLGCIYHENKCSLQLYYNDIEKIRKILPTRKGVIILASNLLQNPLLFEIKIIKKGIENYYGFELNSSSNRRFCLGDCIVTHNTVLALYIISAIKTKTLIVVHKGFLMDQWISRIKQFLPSARIGMIQQQKIIVDECDIVLSMLQSLAIKSYPPETFQQFGMTIVDECHHAAAEVFSRALSKISTKYMVGLSATLDRKDGLRRVFEWYLGDVAISIQKQDVGTVLVDIEEYKEEKSEYKRLEYNMNGFIKQNVLIDNIVNSMSRNSLIIKLLKNMYDDNRHILLITERRSHVDNIYNMLNDIGIESGKYMGNMSKIQLQESESKRVILGTYNMISEGFDVPVLDSLIFATPKSDIEQAVGRILRQGKNRATIPKIIDIYDTEIKPFETRLKARKQYYKKHKYTINI